MQQLVGRMLRTGSWGHSRLTSLQQRDRAATDMRMETTLFPLTCRSSRCEARLADNTGNRE